VTAGAWVRAIVGGCVAGLVMWVPAMWRGSVDAQIAGYIALVVVLLSVQAGVRADAAAVGAQALRRRVLVGTQLALVEAAVVGFGLYALYAWFKPTVLAERFAALYEAAVRAPPDQVARRLEVLAQGRTQYLDPAFQAVQGAVTVFFAALLLVTYSAIRERVRQRFTVRPKA